MKRGPNKLAKAKLRTSPSVPQHRSGTGDASGNSYLDLEIRIRGEVGY